MAYSTAILCVIFFAILLVYGIIRKERDRISFVIVLFSFTFMIVFAAKAHKSAELIDKENAIHKNVTDIINQFR